MALNPVFLSPHNFKQKKSISVEFASLIVATYLREFLWNTPNEFPRFLLHNLVVFKVQLQTLLEIPQRENNFGELNW